MPLPEIPDHELIRRIGQGGYGDVWLARNIMDAWRAVKIVTRERFDSARPYEREFDGIRRFEPISRTHESQLDILHVGRDESGGYFYYVMELADDVSRGRVVDPGNYDPHTLRAELKEHGRLPAARCLDIGIALATALEHLHSHGLIHRDVKPSNVIFVHGRPKLADIGLVAARDATLSFVGTEGYVPPEGPGSERADLFALGKVLYEMHTGLPCSAFPDQPTDLLPSDDPRLARELNLIVVKACAPDSGRRQATLKALREEMEILKAGRSVERLWLAEEERHAAASREQTLRRRVRRFGLVGAVAVVLVASAGSAWQQHRSAKREKALATRTRDFLARMLELTTGKLSEALEPLGKLSVLTAVNEDVATIFDSGESEPLFMALEAEFLKSRSRVDAALGRGAGAIRAATKASELLERLRVADPADSRWLRELAEADLLLAAHHASHGEHDKAHGAAQSGLARLGETQAPLLRVRLLRSLGNARAKLRRNSEAVEIYERTISEIEAAKPRVSNAADYSAWQTELALVHQDHAQLWLDHGDHARALASFHSSAACLPLASLDPRCRLLRVRTQTGIANALGDGGRAAEGLAAHRQAYRLATELAASDSENALWQREQALSGAVLAKQLHSHSEEFDQEVGELFARSERQLEALLELDSNAEAWKWDYAGTKLAHGIWHFDRKRFADSLTRFREALDVMEVFAGSEETPVDRPYGLAVMLRWSWMAYRKLGERRVEERAHVEGWVRKARSASASNPAWRFVSASGEHLLGEIARSQGHVEDAIAAHDRALEELNLLFIGLRPEQRPHLDFEWREKNARHCLELVHDLRRRNDGESARAFAARALRAIFLTGNTSPRDAVIAERVELERMAVAP